MQMVTLGLPPKYRKSPAETMTSGMSIHRRAASDSLTMLTSTNSSSLFMNTAEPTINGQYYWKSTIGETTNGQYYSKSTIGETSNGHDGRQACDAMEEMKLFPPSDDRDKQKSSVFPPSSASTAVLDANRINNSGPTMQSTETDDDEHLEDDELDIKLKFGHKFAPNVDPKKIKRILANRLSAQRSRMKKLEYRAQLEKTVDTLKREVNFLTPQVAHCERQRYILRMENNALKQRMAQLANEKVIKEAQFHVLREEIEHLTQIYLIQQQRKDEEEQNLSVVNGSATSVEGSEEEGMQQQQEEQAADENSEFVNSLIG